jgi:hypothetical protein
VATGWKARGLEIVLRLKRACLEIETSSSKEDLLRLLAKSRRFGSTFSESEFSGEAARRLREGAEEGVMAEMY